MKYGKLFMTVRLCLPKNKEEEEILKPSCEWNKLEKRKTSLNFKAMNDLFYALDKKGISLGLEFLYYL